MQKPVAAPQVEVGSPIFAGPAVMIAALFFLVPMGILAFNSLTVPAAGRLAFSLDNFSRALFDEFYWEVLLRTLRIGLLTTLWTLVLGYPAALFLYFSRSRWRQAFLLILVSPLFVSVVVRTYGWIILLSPNGAVNAFLPDDYKLRLLQTDTAVVLGLMHIYLPLMVLSINAALTKVDRRLITAATTLGASNWQILRDILLPLSKPGVVAGCVIVFSIAMTAFSTPVLLGGSRNKTMPYVVYQTNLVVGDWHLGSALAFILLFLTIAVVQIISRLGHERQEAQR
jgi:putative spermidine/putrescine transport system permease protein